MNTSFPFPKLRDDKYLILDVMMFIEYDDITYLMFDGNKETRKFLHDNYITIRNGFINDGLIFYDFDGNPAVQFNNYDKLEKLYF